MSRSNAASCLVLLLLCVTSSGVDSAKLLFDRQWVHPTELYTGDRTAAAAKGLTAARATIDATERLQLTVEKTTLVLPVTKRDFERFLVLLASLHRFLDATVVSEMVLLVRGDEVAAWQQISSLPSPFPIRVVGEEALVNYKWNTYRLQMMLKLLISEHITTRFYFVLDADLILRKPFGRAELLCPDNRAPYNPEPVYVHRDWWQASYNVLTMDAPKCMEVAAFGVTPAVLATTTSRAVVAWMDAIYTRNWTVHFQHGDPVLNGLWTEYTMYGLVGCATSNFEKAHGCERHFYTGIWMSSEVKQGAQGLWEYLVKSNPTDPPFVVLQEEAGVPLMDVVQAAKMMLADSITNKHAGGAEPVLAKLLQEASTSIARQAGG